MPKNQLSNFSSVLIDERTDSAQIAPNGVYYSVMNYNNIKVYSFINASIKDVSKRDGFYAVRLLVGASSNIKNVENVLNKIAQRYHNSIQTNSQAIQDYKDILAEAQVETNKIIKSRELSSSDKYYFLKDAGQSVSELLNSKAASYVNLLYIFKNGEAIPNAISHFNFQPAQQLETRLNIISVDNSSAHLSKILINNQEVSGSLGEQIKLLVHQNDEIISINKDNERTLHSPNHSHIKIAGPRLRDIPESRSNNQRNMEDFSPRSFMLGAGLVLLLAALSLGGLYFLKYKPLQKEIKEKQNEISNLDEVKKELENYEKADALGIIKDEQGNKYAIVNGVVLKGNVNGKYEYILTNKFYAIDENTITKVSKDNKIKKIEKEFGFDLIKSSNNQVNTDSGSSNKENDSNPSGNSGNNSTQTSGKDSNDGSENRKTNGSNLHNNAKSSSNTGSGPKSSKEKSGGETGGSKDGATDKNTSTSDGDNSNNNKDMLEEAGDIMDK
ncbi:hypothetical protein NLM59_07490 [Weeksellaceae bacterium KMM 9724]|uniref:hypothetical protein n=1 Tax=Profundicola chukchiensis TaxID=2961959 RepID=UPI00243A6FF4|nr:hypothetical protein [Profundicola chukchiensis]MDG4950764.1 hypothetical protein [Profundicola chukchiensis]